MLCDGAKGGCAFKLATAASEAVLCALLASQNIHIGHGQGIVSIRPETTIQNLGTISTQACARSIKRSSTSCWPTLRGPPPCRRSGHNNSKGRPVIRPPFFLSEAALASYCSGSTALGRVSPG